ncbi:hypothetical protein EDB89DRAFT_1946868 [Lactarius sanguifluus]|nr:hypothetical protein EDB89DRAFT_1946868 [Lactarius sanguifluus]
MPSFLFYSIFLLPFTLMSVLAQSNNASSPSPSVVVSTSLSVGISFGPNRQPVTVTAAIPVTLTLSPTPTPSGNTTGNSTTSSNSTSSPPTSTAPLPTAPTNVYGGGDGPGGAPSPGQSGQGGVFGPPDGYVSGVTRLQRNAMVVSLFGVVIGSLLSLL